MNVCRQVALDSQQILYGDIFFERSTSDIIEKQGLRISRLCKRDTASFTVQK